MVEVGMGDEDVIDLHQGLEVERGDAGAGVDQDVVVDLQAGGVAPAADAAAAAEDGEFHRCSCRAHFVV
jgi:hypothetical protein